MSVTLPYALNNFQHDSENLTTSRNPLIYVFCECLKAKASGNNDKIIVCAAIYKLIYLAFGCLNQVKFLTQNIFLINA